MAPWATRRTGKPTAADWAETAQMLREPHAPADPAAREAAVQELIAAAREALPVLDNATPTFENEPPPGTPLAEPDLCDMDRMHEACENDELTDMLVILAEPGRRKQKRPPREQAPNTLPLRCQRSVVEVDGTKHGRGDPAERAYRRPPRVRQ
jgi:hypothetical protein